MGPCQEFRDVIEEGAKYFIYGGFVNEIKGESERHFRYILVGYNEYKYLVK